MKTIICPTDFSKAANNAIEYSAKLAQQINAKILLLNIQHVLSATPVVSGMEAIHAEESLVAVLEKISDEINRNFGVPCSYKVETTVEDIESAISREVNKNESIVVIGTNGLDDLYQYVFGSNSYNVVKKIKSPVIIVPENVEYRPLKKLALLWDYTKGAKFLYGELKRIWGKTEPEINFIHISRLKSEIGDDVFNALKEDVSSFVGSEENISFKHLYAQHSEQFAAVVDDYIADSKADALVVVYYDRGKLKGLFHGSIVKELTEVVQYPLIAFHQEL